jgi:hypothetical protein
MKYHGINDRVITVCADSKALRRYSRTTRNDFSSITPPHDEPCTTVTEETEFDPRLDEYVSNEKAEKPLPLEARTRFERPKPNREFITVWLDENPAKVAKIGANLPLRIQEALTRCLRANTDVFATTPEEMSGIDPEVACHNLNINPSMKCVTQRRRKQSAEKTDAAKTIVKGLALGTS